MLPQLPEDLWILLIVLVEVAVWTVVKYLPISSDNKPQIVLGLAAAAGLGAYFAFEDGLLLALAVFYAVRSASNLQEVKTHMFPEPKARELDE